MQAKATAAGAVGNCYNGPLTRAHNPFHWALPTTRAGVPAFVQAWRATLQAGGCLQAGTAAAEELLQAAVFSLVGVSIRGAMMKIAPSWDLGPR